MQNKQFILICFTGVTLTGLSGCDSQTKSPALDRLFESNAIKQEAIKLDADVLSFKAEMQNQVNTLNKSFQDTSEKLMDQLTILLNSQLDLSRDLDAQAMADAAVQNPNKVLMPGVMHDVSLNYINDQFAQIQAVDDEITAARTKYASSAKNLTVALDQLTNCDSALKKLIADDPANESQTLLEDIEGSFNGVKAGIAAADKGSGTSASAPKVQGEQ